MRKISWLKKAETQKIILANAFSLSMISDPEYSLSVKEISEDEVKNYLSRGFESAIGHESTAQLLTTKLGVEVPFNRISVALDKDTILIVAQLMGPRKEYKDMTSEEIEKYPIKYFLVTLKKPETE